jgi:chromosome segregation ATPase
VPSQRLQDCKDKIARKEKEQQELEQELNMPEQDQEGLQSRIQALLLESKEQAALKKELADKYRQAAGPYKQVQNQIQNLNRDVANAKKEARAAQKRLEEYRDKMMSHEGSAEAQREGLAAKLRAMEKKRLECKEQADPLQQAVAEAYRAYEDAEPKVQEAKHNVSNAARQLDRVKERLRSLQDSGDEFAVFGPKVKAVHRLVSSPLASLRSFCAVRE